MAWNDAVVTNAGAVMLSGSISGPPMSITGASGGSGIVPPASLMAQTGLANQKQELSLVSVTKTDRGIRLRIQILSDGLETGYRLNQIGVWAAVGAGAPVLLAILQDADGIPIPSYNDLPEFLLQFFAILPISNMANIDLAVDTSALATQGDIAALKAAVTPRDIAFTIPAGDDPGWSGDGAASAFKCDVINGGVREWMNPTVDVDPELPVATARAQIKL